jgi:hypothetical protein
MKSNRKTINPHHTNLLVDVLMFFAFLVAMDVNFTGVSIHEILCLSLAATLVLHMLLHWNWISQVTRRMFGKLAFQARINYILNFLLFMDMVVITFTGIMISKTVVPALGIEITHSRIWRVLHSTSADLSLVILGLHIALHWKWLLSVVNRLFKRPARVMAVRAQSEVTR